MRLAAQELRFEEAAKIRDHMRALEERGSAGKVMRPRERRGRRRRY
jgi:excinuclease UvrABC nuclease subunit